MRAFSRFEKILVLLGLLIISVYAAARFYRGVSSHVESAHPRR